MLSRNMRLMATAAGVVLAALAVSGCRPDTRLAESPVAVVASTGSLEAWLTAVDLETMKPIRKRKLRSLCFEIAGDQKLRTVATAQTGGLGADVDDALGVWDLRTDWLGYVELPISNPSGITVNKGVAYSLHGLFVNDSLTATTVDLASMSVIATGYVSEWSNNPVSANGSVYFPISKSPDDSLDSGYTVSEGGVFATTPELETTLTVALPRRALTVVADPASQGGLIAIGTRYSGERDDLGQWRISRLDPMDGSVIEDHPLPLRMGMMSACTVGSEIAVADANAIDVAVPGDTVVMIDAQTLEITRRIRIDGCPTAVAAWKDRLVVFDGPNHELLLFEPGEETPSRRVVLDVPADYNGDIVVFDSIAQRE